jgi:hypothetical protein
MTITEPTIEKEDIENVELEYDETLAYILGKISEHISED